MFVVPRLSPRPPAFTPSLSQVGTHHGQQPLALHLRPLRRRGLTTTRGLRSRCQSSLRCFSTRRARARPRHPAQPALFFRRRAGLVNAWLAYAWRSCISRLKQPLERQGGGAPWGAAVRHGRSNGRSACRHRRTAVTSRLDCARLVKQVPRQGKLFTRSPVTCSLELRARHGASQTVGTPFSRRVPFKGGRAAPRDGIHAALHRLPGAAERGAAQIGQRRAVRAVRAGCKVQV